jgi:hypothetical protein
MNKPYRPYTERFGSPPVDSLDALCEALGRYWEAEDRALLAAFGRCPAGPGHDPFGVQPQAASCQHRVPIAGGVTHDRPPIR